MTVAPGYTGALPALGKRDPHPIDHPHRRVKLATYLAPGLSAPSAVDWTGPVKGWDAYGNLVIGDCSCAAPANLIRCWTANTGTQKDIPIADVLKAYTVVSGYDPEKPETDNGAVISDVLKLWSAQGVGGIGGDVLAAFAEVDHSSPFHIQLAVHLFGGCIVGLQMPKSAQAMLPTWQTPAGLSGDDAPGSWGGHCIVICGYTPDGATVISWGQVFHATWGWLAAYVDEAWAPVSADWLEAGKSPGGLDLDALKADLATIGDVDP